MLPRALGSDQIQVEIACPCCRAAQLLAEAADLATHMPPPQVVLGKAQHTSSSIATGSRCPEARVSDQCQIYPHSTHQKESKDGGLVVLDQLAFRLHLVELLSLQSQPALMLL